MFAFLLNAVCRRRGPKYDTKYVAKETHASEHCFASRQQALLCTSDLGRHMAQSTPHGCRIPLQESKS